MFWNIIVLLSRCTCELSPTNFSRWQTNCVHQIMHKLQSILILTSKNLLGIWDELKQNNKFVSHFNRAQTHNLVSAASFCMISMMVVQALEQPSGVEWIVMGFSAAPAFSFLWMSILEEKMRQGQLFVKHLVQKWGRSKCSTLDKKASVRDVERQNKSVRSCSSLWRSTEDKNTRTDFYFAISLKLLKTHF